MKTQATSNQQKAPICAAFVEAMREVFGAVQVSYVKEGSFELGRPDQTIYATVFQKAISKDSPSRGKDEKRKTEA